MASSVWTKVAGFRHGNPLLSSVLIFVLVVVVGFLLHLIWTPLAQGYLLALLLLFLGYELRKRVLADRSSLVWIPSLVAPGLILLSPITEDQRALLICLWILASVFLLKLRRRSFEAWSSPPMDSCPGHGRLRCMWGARLEPRTGSCPWIGKPSGERPMVFAAA